MPWQSPTLNDLAEQARNDIKGRLLDAQPALRRSLLRVIADVDAGVAHGLYGYLEWLARQVIIDTAEAEWLERWASVWKIYRIKATAAAGAITVTGTPGEQIVAGREWEAESGAAYVVDETVTLGASGDASVSVTATKTGSQGNMEAGETLRAISAIPGVDAEATVAAGGITGGAAVESDDRLRQRLLDRIQNPPHGGNEADYQAWAREAHPDVTRVWVAKHQPDIGEVTIRFVCDELDDIVPSAEVIDTVTEYIDEVRPVTARGFYAIAPTIDPIDFQIRLTPDSQEARDRVRAALRDYLSQTGEPGATSYREQLSGVIYIAAGDSRHEMPVPSSNIHHDVNALPVLGEIEWL